MLSPEYQSIDEAQVAILDHLLAHGELTSPRGLPTLEGRAVSFTILDPRRRCVLNPARKWSLPLALGETCWHLSGSTAAKDLAYYAPVWESFADDEGQIRGSCYGSKMFVGDPSPWQRLVKLLSADRESRRAILYFNDSVSHLAIDCRDAACATSIQFLIRGGKLDAVVCMRSNDAIWGLPYDVFLFTFLQELLAVSLGLELGRYHHIASSLHIYQRHVALASRVLEFGQHEQFLMPPMQNPEMLPIFLAMERGIRTDKPRSSNANVSAYWQDLVEVLRLFRKSRDIGWPSILESNFSSAYLPVLVPLSMEQKIPAGV